MKKTKLISLLCLSLFIFLGCEETPEKIESPSGLRVTEGRLHFTDEESLTEICMAIQNNSILVANDKIESLPYSSFLSSINLGRALDPKLNDNDLEVLDLDDFQLIANDKGEFQVGEYIYQIQGNKMIILAKNGSVKHTIEEVVRFEESKNAPSNAREIGDWYNYWFQDPLTSYTKNVRYRFKSVTSWLKINFYLEVESRNTLMALEKSEYIELWSGLCWKCNLPNSVQWIKRDVSSASWLLGSLTLAQYADNGIELYADFYVKYKNLAKTGKIVHCTSGCWEPGPVSF